MAKGDNGQSLRVQRTLLHKPCFVDGLFVVLAWQNMGWVAWHGYILSPIFSSQRGQRKSSSAHVYMHIRLPFFLELVCLAGGQVEIGPRYVLPMCVFAIAWPVEHGLSIFVLWRLCCPWFDIHKYETKTRTKTSGVCGGFSTETFYILDGSKDGDGWDARYGAG